MRRNRTARDGSNCTRGIQLHARVQLHEKDPIACEGSSGEPSDRVDFSFGCAGKIGLASMNQSERLDVRLVVGPARSILLKSASVSHERLASAVLVIAGGHHHGDRSRKWLHHTRVRIPPRVETTAVGWHGAGWGGMGRDGMGMDGTDGTGWGGMEWAAMRIICAAGIGLHLG